MLFIIPITLISQLAFSGTLVLSGTVLDTGFSIQNSNSAKTQQISLNRGTGLKVYVSQMAVNNRSPQSVDLDVMATSDSANSNWKRLEKTQNLTASSYIRVKAP